MTEVWKDIDGFSGYQVSNFGRVRTYKKVTSNKLYPERHWKDRILKQKCSPIHGRRDCRVNLWENGNAHTFLVSRLVAEAFLGTPPEKMTVNHKDGNPMNNHIDNLEWLSLADNIRHGFENGFFPQTRCSLVNDKGEKITLRSKAEASRFLGRSHSYLYRHGDGSQVTDVNGNKYQFVIEGSDYGI